MTESSEGRVFLRGVVSTKYALDDLRRATLTAPRVRGGDVVTDDGSVGHHGMSEDSDIWWRLAPGDDPFLTQTLQVHFVTIAPGKANRGHGHQNEAVFYILRGHGHEVHDGRRHDWKEGDLVVVHTDSVHQHFNDSEETALTLVIKPKAMWMYLGLLQQGKIGNFADPDGAYGPRVDWSLVWTEGVEGLAKVVTPTDVPWEDAEVGRVRRLTGPARPDVRCFSVDSYLQEIPPGGSSSRHWRMGDEVVYVVAGQGESLHWEVAADLDDRYHARIANEPSRHAIQAGDVMWVPQNTVRQHVCRGDEPLVLLSAQNAVFRHLGYDRTHVFEPPTSPEQR